MAIKTSYRKGRPARQKIEFYTLARYEFTPELRLHVGATLGHPDEPATQDECRAYMQSLGDLWLRGLAVSEEGA